MTYYDSLSILATMHMNYSMLSVILNNILAYLDDASEVLHSFDL